MIAERTAAEVQLEAVEALVHVGSWRWDVAADQLTGSDELFRIHGLKPASGTMTLSSYLELSVPEDQAEASAAIQRALKTGDAFDFSNRIRRPDDEVRYLRNSGRIIRDEDGMASLLIGACQDITDALAATEGRAELGREQLRRSLAESHRERASFLAEAVALLSSSLDYETTLSRLAEIAVPRIADWCAIDMRSEDGSIERLAVAHPDPAMEELAREIERKFPPDPNAPTGVPNVLRTGESELVPELPVELILNADMDEEHREMILRLNLRSYMIVPLSIRDSVLGAITFVSAESRISFTEDDLEFAQDLAKRAASAIENARLYSEARRANAELIDREQQFRFLADSIPVQVWTATPDGQLDYVNYQTERYFGQPSDKLTGQQWAAFLHPDQVPDIIERWTHSLTTGEPYQVEFLLMNAEGDFRWHLARARARVGGDGEVDRWFGTNTDIHEAKEAEAERQRLVDAREAERMRLLDVFDQAPAFIATLVGPRHIFETANPGYLELVGRDERILGQSVAEALPEVVDQGFVALLDRVYSSGEPYIGNELPVTLRRTPDSQPEQLFVNFLYQPMLEADGSVSGIFVHGIDVTALVKGRLEVEANAEELTRTAQQLQATNQELDQFAYVASHDLKAPLRGIANLSQWIEEDLEGQVEGEVKQHLDLLRGRVLRMEGLIDGILEYSRVGRSRESSQKVDTKELIEGIVDLLAPEDVEVVIEGEMPGIVTETLPLRQVFMNLIGNAIKFSPSDGTGRVRISAEEEGEFYRFSVSDNGPGIASEYHDRIFVIFQTLHARDEIEGTGIGLSLVRKIVRNRGGEVIVRSEEGDGATFEFLWPRES